MNGRWSHKERKQIAERNDIADLRSPGMGITPKGGHPTQYMSSSSHLLLRFFYRYPFVSTPDEAVRFVAKQSRKEPTTSRSLLRMGLVLDSPDFRY